MKVSSLKFVLFISFASNKHEKWLVLIVYKEYWPIGFGFKNLIARQNRGRTSSKRSHSKKKIREWEIDQRDDNRVVWIRVRVCGSEREWKCVDVKYLRLSTTWGRRMNPINPPALTKFFRRGTALNNKTKEIKNCI